MDPSLPCRRDASDLVAEDLLKLGGSASSAAHFARKVFALSLDGLRREEPGREGLDHIKCRACIGIAAGLQNLLDGREHLSRRLAREARCWTALTEEVDERLCDLGEAREDRGVTVTLHRLLGTCTAREAGRTGLTKGALLLGANPIFQAHTPDLQRARVRRDRSWHGNRLGEFGIQTGHDGQCIVLQ